MSHNPTISWCVAIVLLTATAFAQDEKVQVKLPASILAIRAPKLEPPEPGKPPTSKLAPELEALKRFGGRLYGRTRKGTAVLGFDSDREMTAARALVRPTKGFAVVRGVVPESIQVFTKYMISYSYDGENKTPNRTGLDREGLRKLELELLEDNEFASFLLVKAPSGFSQSAAVELEKNPGVVFVEPDYEIVLEPVPEEKSGERPAQENPVDSHTQDREQRDFSISALAVIPNDPSFGVQWGLTNIHAPDAWDSSTQSPRIVAVVDTGIDAAHPDLTGNQWTNIAEQTGSSGVDDDGNGFVDDIHGFDFARNDGDPNDETLATAPFPPGHGTHVAGTIGAVGNNNRDVSGVVWQCRLMAVKFMTPRHVTLPDGTVIATSSGSTSNAIRCIRYAVQNGASVINASYGSTNFSNAERNAIAAARDRGVIFVAAAGNGGPDGVGDDNDATPHYPSSYDLENIISVAAINRLDNLTGFSNFGSVTVDIAAPGQTILSTVPGWSPNAPIANLSGTSMATPHVSGAAALVWGHPLHAGRSWKEVIGLILANSRSLTSLSGRCVTGGTLDLAFLAPPIPAAGEAYASFNSRTVRGSMALHQIRFTLDEPMFVHVTAHASADLRYPSRGKAITVSLSTTAGSSGTLSDSVTKVTLSNRGVKDEFQTSVGLRLAAGNHVVFFRIDPNDSRGFLANVGPGTIMVEAFGRSIGGVLR